MSTDYFNGLGVVMTLLGSKCVGSPTGALLYAVDTKLIKALEQKLDVARNIATPFFIILGREPDELSAANRKFDAKGCALREVQDKIDSLLNTARIGCPGTSKAKKLERMSQEAASEIKKMRRCRPTKTKKLKMSLHQFKMFDSVGIAQCDEAATLWHA